jgi:hypothetical protein
MLVLMFVSIYSAYWQVMFPYWKQCEGQRIKLLAKSKCEALANRSLDIIVYRFFKGDRGG